MALKDPSPSDSDELTELFIALCEHEVPAKRAAVATLSAAGFCNHQVAYELSVYMEGDSFLGRPWQFNGIEEIEEILAAYEQQRSTDESLAENAPSVTPENELAG
jgi:U3 small nucleolar ribonucleoprotein component